MRGLMSLFTFVEYQSYVRGFVVGFTMSVSHRSSQAATVRVLLDTDPLVSYSTMAARILACAPSYVLDLPTHLLRFPSGPVPSSMDACQSPSARCESEPLPLPRVMSTSYLFTRG